MKKEEEEEGERGEGVSKVPPVLKKLRAAPPVRWRLRWPNMVIEKRERTKRRERRGGRRKG